MSDPNNLTVPEVAPSSVPMTFKSDVLPPPEGPRIMTNSPFRTAAGGKGVVESLLGLGTSDVPFKETP